MPLMSILKSLKLAAATPANPTSSEHGFRAKLLAYLAEQKAMAEAEIAGTPFTATRRVTRVEGDQKVRVDAPRRVRKGWFTDAKGKLFFQIRYGGRSLEFTKGMNAVEVESMAEMPAIIGSIIEAVSAGELDPQLTTAIAQRKANFKPKAKKAAA
jgi:soluble lytic murein transglycosylase-like protein